LFVWLSISSVIAGDGVLVVIVVVVVSNYVLYGH
jgi:hypothetical protein